jgi:hypothetical protein
MQAVLGDMQQLEGGQPAGSLQGGYGQLVEAHRQQQEAARALLQGLQHAVRAQTNR